MHHPLHRTRFSYRGGWVYQVVFQEACFLYIGIGIVNTELFWREKFSPAQLTIHSSVLERHRTCIHKPWKWFPHSKSTHKILIFTSILHNSFRTYIIAMYHTAVKHWLTMKNNVTSSRSNFPRWPAQLQKIVWKWDNRIPCVPTVMPILFCFKQYQCSRKCCEKAPGLHNHNHHVLSMWKCVPANMSIWRSWKY